MVRLYGKHYKKGNKDWITWVIIKQKETEIDMIQMYGIDYVVDGNEIGKTVSFIV